jgi:hypothetical protein
MRACVLQASGHGVTQNHKEISMMGRGFLVSNIFSSFASLENHWTTKASKLDFRSGLGDSGNFRMASLWHLSLAEPAVAVEIRSARGKSACYIRRALKKAQGASLPLIHMPFSSSPSRSSIGAFSHSRQIGMSLDSELENLLMKARQDTARFCCGV